MRSSSPLIVFVFPRMHQSRQGTGRTYAKCRCPDDRILNYSYLLGNGQRQFLGAIRAREVFVMKGRFNSRGIDNSQPRVPSRAKFPWLGSRRVFRLSLCGDHIKDLLQGCRSCCYFDVRIGRGELD
jgi:hypothetical protein